MVEHHDAEFKRLMTWQVLMQDEVRTLAEEEKAYRREQRERDAESRQMQREWETEYRKMLRERDEVLNGRIDKLVSAIGELIQHLPRTQA
jgi:thymidylate synthase